MGDITSSRDGRDRTVPGKQSGGKFARSSTTIARHLPMSDDRLLCQELATQIEQKALGFRIRPRERSSSSRSSTSTLLKDTKAIWATFRRLPAGVVRVSDFMKFKNDLNATAVTPKLLGEVMVMYAGLPPEERIFEARAKRVIALLRNRGHGNNCGLLAMAITIRLMALDVILKDHEVQRWTLPGGGPDVTYVHSYLLKVAADAPLVEGPNGQRVFDSTDFRRRTLRIAGTGGHA